MINNDRIVPITKIDYLSLIGTIFNLAGDYPIQILKPDDVEGNFTNSIIDANIVLANQPVKTLNFLFNSTTEKVARVLFVADYQFEGFKVNGEPQPISGASIRPDAVTLYLAYPGDSDVTVSQYTPEFTATGSGGDDEGGGEPIDPS